ncbi:MAG: sigma-54-dependent transcriptional regulator [Verrucomicrobiales bacterium]
MQQTVLIVDDEKNTREGLRLALEDEFDVYIAADSESARRVLSNEQVDLMLIDLRLGTENGMELMEQALGLARPPICLIMTAYGSVENAVEAMKRGAYDFVTKPVDIEQLDLRIKRALSSRALEKENRELKQQVQKRYGMDNLIGESSAMLQVVDLVQQVAPTKATVLIEGESGTGKELVAHAIHHLSRRNAAKFVAVHCAALSANLLESELFGHEKGAFTGATERRIGRFEQASGGTIFLDEIGEIDASVQVKLLRVLGEKNIERVGGNSSIPVDIRLVCATNRNLEEMVKEGAFRDDLYHRINVVQITMPPLRDRKDDIPLLARSFLKQAAKENERKVSEMTHDAMHALMSYDWPGNVRELRTAMEHGVVMSRNEKLTLRDLPGKIREQAPARLSRKDTEHTDSLNLREAEVRLIEEALAQTGGNRSHAAKRLGISRRTLQRRLRELDLDDPNQPDAEEDG